MVTFLLRKNTFCILRQYSLYAYNEAMIFGEAFLMSAASLFSLKNLKL